MTGRPPTGSDASNNRGTGPSPVLRLSVLGGLQVAPLEPRAFDEAHADPAVARWSAEVHELGRRRRKLALLVYLHGASRPVSRDLLLDLLWPEEDPERGRHSLIEALSHLRRVLGRDALGARGGDVRLAPGVPLVSDVEDFDRAVLRGDSDGIVSLYTGPFLDGVFVDRAPRFDLWVASEREQRRRQLVAACQSICATPLTAESAPRHASAARRWLDASPGSADAARRWIDALTVAGTDEALRAGLIAFEQVAREAQLDDDEPLPPVLQQLGEQLREQVAQAEAEARWTLAWAPTVVDGALRIPTPHGPSLVTEPDAVTARPTAYEPHAPHDAHEVAPDPKPGPEQPTSARPTSARPRRRWLALAGVLAAGSLLVTAWLGRRPADVAATPQRPWIVMAPVALSGVADSTNMAGAIGVALASALSRYPSVDMVAPSRVAATLTRMQRPDSVIRDERAWLEVAERIGASVVAFPEAASLGRTAVLRVRLVSPQGLTPVAAAEARVAGTDDWIEAVDAVVANVVRAVDRAGRIGSAATPLPPATTRSLPALRAYAAARGAQQRRAWDDAVLALQQAVTLDTAFAQAWADLGELFSLLNRPRDADTAFAKALASAATLAPRERLLVRTVVLREQRQFDAALREVDGWLLANPADRELRAEQAELLRRRGDDVGARRALASLLAVDSLDPGLWLSYASALGLADHPAAQDSAARAYERAARLDSAVRTDAVFNNQWGGALVRTGRTDSAARIFALMLDQSPALRARGLRSQAHVAIWRQRPAEAVPLLREALQLEERVGAGATSVVRTRLLLAVLLDRSGDTVNARRQRDSTMQRALALDLQEPLLYYLLGKERARHGELRDARAVLARLDAVVVPTNPRHMAMRLLTRAELDLAEGNLERASARADSGVALDETTLTLDTQARVLRRVAETAGDATSRRRAADADRRLATRREFGWEGTLASIEARARIEPAGGAIRDVRRDRR